MASPPSKPPSSLSALATSKSTVMESEQSSRSREKEGKMPDQLPSRSTATGGPARGFTASNNNLTQKPNTPHRGNIFSRSYRSLNSSREGDGASTRDDDSLNVNGPSVDGRSLADNTDFTNSGHVNGARKLGDTKEVRSMRPIFDRPTPIIGGLHDTRMGKTQRKVPSRAAALAEYDSESPEDGGVREGFRKFTSNQQGIGGQSGEYFDNGDPFDSHYEEGNDSGPPRKRPAGKTFHFRGNQGGMRGTNMNSAPSMNQTPGPSRGGAMPQSSSSPPTNASQSFADPGWAHNSRRDSGMAMVPYQNLPTNNQRGLSQDSEGSDQESLVNPTMKTRQGPTKIKLRTPLPGPRIHPNTGTTRDPHSETVFVPRDEILPSRFSGGDESWGVNAPPVYVKSKHASNAALKKRGLERGKADIVCKRGYGANDPENIMIINLYDNYPDMTWEDIAAAVNEKRMAEGKKPTLSANGCTNRYNRNAPLIYAAEGRLFTPLSQRDRNFRRGAKIESKFEWNDEYDELLVDIARKYEHDKWETVAQRFTEQTGKGPIDYRQAAMRHAQI